MIYCFCNDIDNYTKYTSNRYLYVNQTIAALVAMYHCNFCDIECHTIDIQNNSNLENTPCPVHPAWVCPTNISPLPVTSRPLPSSAFCVPSCRVQRCSPLAASFMRKRSASPKLALPSKEPHHATVEGGQLGISRWDFKRFQNWGWQVGVEFWNHEC